MNRKAELRTRGALLLLASLLTGFTQTARADEDDRVELSGTHADQQFLAGKQVRVRDAELTDAFAAGGEVLFERVVAEDIYAAGGSVRYRNATLMDLVTVGGEVVIASEIQDDLIGAGGRFRIDPITTIGGDAVIAGGDLEFAGSIAGDVVAAGGRVVFAGNVGGNVDVIAGEVIVEPGARIAGRLTYQSDEPARIAPEAVISGTVERKDSPAPEFSTWAAVGIGLAVLLVATLGAILLGLLLQAAFPGPFQAALQTAREHASRSWLIGFALLAATPVAANILLITLVGIPLGLFLYATYAVGLALSIITAASWLGSMLPRKATARSASSSRPLSALRTAVGMSVLLLVGLVPLLGWLLLLIAIPLAAGAFGSAAWLALRGVNSNATSGM